MDCFVVSSIFNGLSAGTSAEELHQVLDEPMEKSNQQVKEKERSSENVFDTKHTILCLVIIAVMLSLKRNKTKLIQQADDGTITTKNSGWLSAQTLLNGIIRSFGFLKDGRLQTKSGSYADKPQDFEISENFELCERNMGRIPKGILVFNVDYDTLWTVLLLQKYFRNGEVNWLLYDVEKQTVQANKGW